MEELQNTSEPNSSMEELKVEEDENLKEISLEDDILGTQSLLMSESDDDPGDDSNLKSKQKKTISKRPKRLSESDDDPEIKCPSAQSNNEEIVKTNKKKISTLIDSDSDDEQAVFNEEKIELTEKGKPAKINFKMQIKKTKSNINAQKKNKPEKKINKKKQKSDTSSNLENIKDDMEDTGISVNESDAEMNISNLEAATTKNKIEEYNEDSTEKDNASRAVRASAKRAMDEMQAIQSEQQRLHREAHISIPYHKPKKHTLDEFLKRRTIIQSQNASSVAAVIQTRSLKMTTEELKEYAKLMEERAKEATEFFKSESESDEEEVFKDNEGILDNPESKGEESVGNTYDKHLDLQNKMVLIEKNKFQNDTIDELNKNQDDVQLTENDLKEILAGEEMSQERSTCPKVLITEVIELPKLDMNTITISPTKTCTARSSLNVRQLLAEKVLPEYPSLSGDPNKLIDLETGNLIEKKSTGMENLMKRLMATIKAKKVKNSETCNILSIENGKLEISRVNITRSEVKYGQKETKPGAAYIELKKNLKEIITKKRLEVINKKQDDELEYNKCLADDDSEGEDEIQESLEEECESDEKPENTVVWVDDEENALLVKDVSQARAGEEYAENIIKDEEDDESVEHEDDADTEKENDHCPKSLDKPQRKSRVITAFDDSDEEGKNDDIDFLKTQPAITQPLLLETQQSVRYEDDENELITLCSGTFDDSKKQLVNVLMSQIPVTENCDKSLNDELMALCSGTFDKPPVTQQQNELENISESSQIKCNKILSSDEENAEEPNNIIDGRKTGKVKRLTKRQKKAKLGFSDDEDDEESKYEEVEQGDVELIDDNSRTATEESDTFIDYDSEENEILVKMTKDDKVKQALKFVENEAELSESEWGSADEDENNIDKYDIELGDEDEFDREKLRTEIGQIHARKMLDEDIREVRKIKELLFEDEETDGVGRQRSFKWKNSESGFSLEDVTPFDEGDNQNAESVDEINEQQWRKIRYEREQFFKEQGLKPNSQDILPSALTNTSVPFKPYNTTVSATSKKLQIITAKKSAISSSDSKKRSPFLISKGVSTMNKKSLRSSFLVRDKETLNKLVGLTKSTSSSIPVSDIDDTATTVSIKTVRPTNFVFATLTMEERENMKRKADDLLNSSNENGKDFMKKPKIEPRRDKCFIDQLL